MNITKTEKNGEITFALDGWLDTLSSPKLGEEIEALTTATKIILDFEKVEYIASSGLRQVVSSHRKAKELNAEFLIINATNEVMSIFELTGLHKKLNISAK